jgi:hypothetical protein
MDIIILIFLIRNLVKIAKRKGESAFKWGIRGVLVWIGGVITGISVVFILIGQNFLYSVIIGYGTAYLFFLILKSSLNSMPDVNEAGIS